MTREVVVLPGDGVGPEVINQAVRVVQEVAPNFSFSEHLIGGAAYDACGEPLPEETLKACKESDAVLLGAVGGAKWDTIEPPEKRPEIGGLLRLRKELNLFANLRPSKVYNSLIAASPVKFGESGPIDCIVVRELTGGIYFGTPRERRDHGTIAVDTCLYSIEEIKRIAIVGFETAIKRRKKIHCVDKANVLETSRLWREVVSEVSQEYPQVELNYQLVDSCAMLLVRDPGRFDVILTENMFGDILSDEAAEITGSLGLLPSASLSESVNGKAFGLYEPAHGSAPDIAGRGIVNPIAAILSGAMMLRYSFGLEFEANLIEQAVEQALDKGKRTRDLGGDIGTQEMSEAIIQELHVSKYV
jgi:3-isopropylmalate dehydrogenase